MDLKEQIEKIVFDKVKELLTEPTSPDFVTIKRACRSIGISRGLLYKLHKGGKIDFYKLAGRTCIKVSELSQIMRQIRPRIAHRKVVLTRTGKGLHSSSQ